MKDVLELHPWNGQPYYIGVFLVGAYQEILGDLPQPVRRHRRGARALVGPTAATTVEHVVEGDAVTDVLRYVQYDRGTLIEKVRRTIEIAMRDGQISLEDSARLRRRYEEGLKANTPISPATADRTTETQMSTARAMPAAQSRVARETLRIARFCFRSSSTTTHNHAADWGRLRPSRCSRWSSAFICGSSSFAPEHAMFTARDPQRHRLGHLRLRRA